MTDLSHMSYGDLVAALRKDLLLDATIDVLPGTILGALVDPHTGAAPFVKTETSQNLTMQAGTVTVTWAGGSNVSNTVAVAFPVPFKTSVSSLVLGAAITNGGEVNFPNWESLTVSGFSVISSDPFGAPVAGHTALISWAALGA